MQVTPVFWTAGRVSASGAQAGDADANALLAVCAVNPQQVTQGLLVCARDATPVASVQGRTAAAQRVDGMMKTFARADLVNAVKASFGVDLVVSADGLPLYLEVEQPLATSTSAPLESVPPPLQVRVVAPAPSTAPLSSSPASQVRDNTSTSTGATP